VWDAVAAPVVSGDGLEIALIGLFGVLVGAVISGGFNLLVVWRKERADAAAESKHHDAEVRRAARLIDDDLHVAQDAVRWCVEHKEWWSSAQRLTSLGWQQYRDVLAPELSDLAWRSVSLAVTVIDRLQWVRDESARSHGAKLATDEGTAGMVAFADKFDLTVVDPVPVTAALAAKLENLLQGLDMGRAALAPLMRDNRSQHSG
jgi:hypothetical protein